MAYEYGAPEFENVHGNPMPPDWIGVVVMSDLVRNDTGRKMIKMAGSDATHWAPLPALPAKTDQP